ncbi:MAG TPA: rhamnulokinase family protein [Rubrobacteraceae bacterium]|nr:rhamnulokinase family protein [Rubrobacteraceae bacterium]
MPEETAFLAVDLGAESGRALLGRFDGERMALEEVHRFPNTPVLLPDGLHWDVLGIFAQIKDGLARTAKDAGRIASMGVDSWGVDFALLDEDGALISNPYHYRDSRTEGMAERAFDRMPREEIYEVTGIQFMPINTLYQLLAMEGSPLLGAAHSLLLIPDLIGYWLTGERACEFTNASTTQLCDARSGGWAGELIEAMGFPRHIFAEIIPPGTQLGSLLPGVADETGAEGGIPVTAVASHDTASAVVAVPAESETFAYISSGTWSLVGVELPEPAIALEGLRANFTNEGGFGGTTRFLKNVMGLWLLQECRRTWAREGQDYSYEELTRLAEAVGVAGSLVDPDDPGFLPPGDMPGRIRRFCAETGQSPPEEPGAVVRCVLESLALKYRWALERAEAITGRRAEVVHIVGGGVRNTLLCQLTADATRRPVLAGPVEATALGNLMVQAYALGYLGSLEEIRAAVRGSPVEVRDYEPEGSGDDWEEAYERLQRIMGAAVQMDREGAGLE